MADPKNPPLGMPKTQTGMAEKDPASPFSPVVSFEGGGVINQPKFPGDRAGEAKESLTVPGKAQAAEAFEQQKQDSAFSHEGNPARSIAQLKAEADAKAVQAKDKAAVEAQAKTASERKVKVKLLCDVWIEEPGHEDAGKDGIRRVKTNIPVLDDNGNPKVDPKSKSPITTHSIVELPLSIAKMMIEQGKAERQDPL